jgi:hypothetical protein
MACSLRFVARYFVLLALATTVSTKAPSRAAEPRGEGAAASLPPEVRLRKLHLVRPDLIPYPIAYEVCC